MADADVDGGKGEALGEVAELNNLLAVVPSRNDDENRARTRVEGLLLVRDTAEACRLVRNGIASYHQVPYWQKAMVLCQMIAGDVDQMMLGLDLLRERGGDEEDPVFFLLSGALFGTAPEIPEDATLTPLHLAMVPRCVERSPTSRSSWTRCGAAASRIPRSRPGRRTSAACCTSSTSALPPAAEWKGAPEGPIPTCRAFGFARQGFPLSRR